MSLFKTTTLKNLDTELKMLSEGRILDEIDSYEYVHILQDRFGREPLSLYQQSLLKSKFPDKEFLTLHNPQKTYYIIIKKPLDVLDFNFKIYKDDFEIQYRHWRINVSHDFLLKCGLERDHPLFIKYVKLFETAIKQKTEELILLKEVSQNFTSGEKLLAEVYDDE